MHSLQIMKYQEKKMLPQEVKFLISHNNKCPSRWFQGWLFQYLSVERTLHGPTLIATFPSNTTPDNIQRLEGSTYSLTEAPNIHPITSHWLRFYPLSTPNPITAKREGITVIGLDIQPLGCPIMRKNGDSADKEYSWERHRRVPDSVRQKPDSLP